MTDTLSEKVARLEEDSARLRDFARVLGDERDALGVRLTKMTTDRDRTLLQIRDATASIVQLRGLLVAAEAERDGWKRRAEDAEVERSALGRDLTEVLDWFRHPAFSKRDLIVDSHHNRTDIKMTWLEYGVGIPPKVMDAIQGPRTTQDAPTPPPAEPIRINTPEEADELFGKASGIGNLMREGRL